MSQTFKYVLGTKATLISTELDLLGSGSLVKSSSSYDNTVGGGGGDGYPMGVFNFTFTCNFQIYVGGLAVWFLSTIDGTNYEAGSSSVMPARPPDLLFKPRDGSFYGTQSIIQRDRLPPGVFYTLVKNEGTGSPLAPSGTQTLEVTPFSIEVV